MDAPRLRAPSPLPQGPAPWLAKACEAAGLGRLHQARLTELGRQTWLADVKCARGSYMLRLARQRHPGWANFERQALAHLVGCGLRVPRPVVTLALPAVVLSAASMALHWTGGDFAAEMAVFHPLPGRERATFVATPAQVHAAGAALGWLHRAGADFLPQRRGHLDPELLPVLLQEGRKFVPWVAGQPGQRQRHDAAHLQARLAAGRLSARLKRGLVHGDMRPRVVRFSGFGGPPEAAIVDLREVAVGPLLVDVGAALCHWGFVADRLELPLVEAFLRGYRQARPCAPGETLQLPHAWRYAAACLALRTLLRHERAPHPSRPYADYRHFLRRAQALDRLGAASWHRLMPRP